MTSMPHEQAAYELEEIWDEDWFPEEDRERVRALAELVPPSSRTLIDVGCGNGLFLNYLQSAMPGRFSRLVGVDRSGAALAHVRTEKRAASVDHLPFADSEFDVATSFEVLEHLPVAIYERAVSELARVAANAIVVCVPYRQDLEAAFCACPVCRTRFNPDYHVRSFDESGLQSLFRGRGFSHVRSVFLGSSTRRYDHEFRERLRGAFKKAEASFSPYAVCPVCGYSDRERLAEELVQRKRARTLAAPPEPRPDRRSALRRFIADAMPRRVSHRWIAAVFTRGGQG